MKHWLNILIIVCVLLTARSVKAEFFLDMDSFKNAYYSEFLEIKVFDESLIKVLVVDDAAEKIGLDADELTDYLRRKVKENFTDIKIEKPDFDKYTYKQIGEINIRIWVVGDKAKVAYHIDYSFWYSETCFQHRDHECYLPIWEDESLGFGSKKNVPDAIKEKISEKIQELAILFYTVRGEL